MEFYEKQLGYVHVDGKKLRRGFTTGTTAAAAAKAAALYLLRGEAEDTVDIHVFSGQCIKIKVESCVLDGEGAAVATVQKYGGDDQDVTNGCMLRAKVSRTEGETVEIVGGEGVGRVTRNGLKIEPGRPAINPKPLELIEQSVRPIAGGQGLRIEISVEDGEALAAKTFNPRLGIEGGISILGTTGIVEPMSEEAFKSSLREELQVKRAEILAYTFGNMGEKSLMELGIPANKICICSNFVGYMLREGAALGVSKVLLAGHIGKLVKLSGGIFHTHSHVADAKNEIIAANLALLGAPTELIEQVMNCITAEESIEYIRLAGYEKVFDLLADKAAQKAGQHTYGQSTVEVIMFDLKNNIICRSRGAEAMAERLAMSSSGREEDQAIKEEIPCSE